MEDATLMMELGCDSVFVGLGVLKSGDQVRRRRAIVLAVHYSDLKALAANIDPNATVPPNPGYRDQDSHNALAFFIGLYTLYNTLSKPLRI
ncbi:hypothetical protein RJ639_038629 [Escallonia herrerae]|uniref:Uncharacterized protein n=1 Tax=Escallonia herrerae TaxID=1293975 RepID=A0AA88WHN1_9ASTE|nr:hypothetical protein RJ639_038629 [Escallonia herrerae]